jgi:hypothetical protein
MRLAEAARGEVETNMANRFGQWILTLGLGLALAACGGGGESATGSGGGDGTTSGNTTTSGGDTTSSTTSGSPSDCALTANTTPTSVTSPSGCHVLERDTSSCKAAREAAGLSGFWLDFSCRVTLSVATQNGAQVVKAATDDQPDYESNYFPTTDACHEDYTAAIQNPNLIQAKNLVIQFPLTTDMNAQPQMSAVVALALNGVVIFGNYAAPGDDIYQEAKTFDRCGAHPQMTGEYHYHSEPYSISYDDANFIGVMRDGYPIYGRKDKDGTYPTLDEYGGHTGVTADSPTTPVYHYHVNEQTSTNPMTAGQKQWFITAGKYRGTPAACGSCN